MNATSRDEIRGRGLAREAGDPKMDQIRELLVGDLVRENEARMAALELRIRELETSLSARIDDLSRRLDSLAGTTDGRHRAAFDELARGIATLGASIQRLGRG